MSFNSLEYLFFLPIVFLLYWSLSRKRNLQNYLIVIASYVFYGLWDYKCLILIFLTSLASYYCGIMLAKQNVDEKKRAYISGINIIINIAILGFFKYFNFFGESFAIVLSSVGIKVDWFTKDIILPVGISFYTFQALSYTIDVYKRKIQATKDFVAFLAFISFFPQLVAGPIERASNLLPQFLSHRFFSYAKAVDGMRLILLGLVKKMLIADNCAVAVDIIFERYQEFDGGTLLYGAMLFAFQIYGDFSGYSDIARGSSKLLGIELMENFKNPYFSRDIAEFWRRWHISLNTWFRDYIYIPLGGSRCSKTKMIYNTCVVFILSGLWHGANWTFISWGAYNALLFIPLLLNGKNRKNINTIAPNRIFPTLIEFVQMGTTFLLVTIGWIFFRATNMQHALSYITRMFSEFSIVIPKYGLKASLFVVLLLIVEWNMRHRKHALDLRAKGMMKYRFIRMLLYFLIFMATLFMSGNNVEFIYFQF